MSRVLGVFSNLHNVKSLGSEYFLSCGLPEQEYEEDDGKIGFKVMLCGDCHRSVTKKNEKTGGPEPEIPGLSIASGVDFGDFRRVGLTPLTLRERNIISKVRHYINIISYSTRQTWGR